MNICLAAFAKSRDDIRPLKLLFAAATAHIQTIIPSAASTAKSFISGQTALYNTDRMASAWVAPVWVQTPDTIASVSSPPVPLDRRISAADYASNLLTATTVQDGMAAFNPGFLATTVDIQERRLRVWSDVIGLGRGYYVEDDRFFAASNSPAALTFFRDGGLEVDEIAWASYAGLGKFVRDRTPFVGVKRMLPSTVATCDERGVRFRSYGDYGALISPRCEPPDYQGTADELQTIVHNAAEMMVRTPEVHLSGGKDSRMTAAAWIASGESAAVMTINTLRQEAVVAERLMAMARERIDLDAQDVRHAIVPPSRARLHQTLPERIEGCMQVWNGDHAALRMINDVNPEAMGPVFISGGGGELAHNGFYKTERQLAMIKASSRPMDRVVAHFSQTSPVPTIPIEGERIIAEQLYDVEDEGRSFGITGPTLVDYYHIRERFRRWTAAGHATNSLALFASPAFVRLSFDVTPLDRLQKLVHRRLTNVFIPGWGDVEYYGGEPSRVDERAEQGLRVWQGDTRDLLFDTIASGKAYRRFWDREGLLDLALRVARGQTDNRFETVFQKMLWYEGFATYAARLAPRVAAARRRALEPGS